MSRLSRASARYLLHHRVQSLLAIAGSALGVAIVIGIQTTQHSARVAFADSIQGVMGTTSHLITAVTGNLDEATLGVVRKIAAHWQPRPVLEAPVRVQRGAASSRVLLLGVDALSFDSGELAAGPNLGRLIYDPGTGMVNQQTAAALKLSVGDTFTLRYGQRQHTLEVLAVLPGSSANRGLLADNVLLVDIATAQEALDRLVRGADFRAFAFFADIVRGCRNPAASDGKTTWP